MKFYNYLNNDRIDEGKIFDWIKKTVKKVIIDPDYANIKEAIDKLMNLVIWNLKQCKKNIGKSNLLKLLI